MVRIMFIVNIWTTSTSIVSLVGLEQVNVCCDVIKSLLNGCWSTWNIMHQMLSTFIKFLLAQCFDVQPTFKSTFTWDPKWTQTGLKSQTALKWRSVYMAIYMEISLQQLSKQLQDPIAHVQLIAFY